MANFEDGSYSSAPGIALIAKVLTGRCRMKYTRASVGQGAIPEGETPKTMRAPAGYVMDAQISAVTNPVNGECQVTVQINSANVEKGFYATGILLYAEDPDEGEIPYTYLVLENGPEWIRPSSSAVGKLATFDLIAAVGAVDRVTATIDPDSIVTRAVVEQLIADATTVLEVTIPKDGWMHDGAGGAYEFHIDIPVEGVTDAMQPFLSVHFEHLKTAADCGLSPSVRTMDGTLCLYAQSEPAADLTATLTLLCIASGIVNGGSFSGAGYALPAATATRLGGVKVGDGLTVASDGTIAINAEQVITTADLVDEIEVAESVANILDGDEAK